MQTATATKSRPRKTPTDAQKAAAKARREAMIALGKRAATLAKTDAPPFIVKLNGAPFSPCNSWLIALSAREGQPFPSTLASFADWRKAGRSVRKGESGYAVWVPMLHKRADADETETVDGDTGKRGFTVGYVFDVTQTDPITAA